MEKLLKLYKFVDGVNDTAFPNVEQQAILYDFRYDAKRMGSVPTISGSIMHPLCLDNLWGNDLVYVFYNGERYFLKQIPTSSYSNNDTRYKHEVEFVSERIKLNNVYFYDVVASDVTYDKPVSNSSNFTFYGDIHEFAQRLNYSLQYAKMDYSVVVDEGISSEAKLVAFQDQFIANVLQESYNTYDIPYYFDNKTIHFGFTNNAIPHIFKYGIDDALLSITKTNANYRVINRITGVGSTDNIPYYYPNKDEKGVSKALYNGNENIVTIIDEQLYKKVKLSDIFAYAEQSSETLILADSNSYIADDKFEVVETSANIWELYQIVYPFSIELSRDTLFEIQYSGADLRNIDIQVYRGNDLLMRTNKLGSFSRNYGQGEYEIRIGVAIYSEEKLDNEYATTILNSINLKVTQQVQKSSAWYLNYAYNIVNLEDYGISINATPTNGDKITFERVSYIIPQINLMPPIYRETKGDERFYKALNDTYINPQTNEYYKFENPYQEGKPKEHIISFEDIKPSIVGMTNAEGLRIDMFSEFAYDANDNDEFDEEGNYIHPYFFAKLRKFDGDYGFNLFAHAIEESQMTISMTSGNCGACNFIIGVSDETQENTVQVDDNGNLLRDSNGNVLYGSPQQKQNDTINNEVWIALKKDIDTFGVIMPNATNNYKPNAGDTFVILHIDLPQSYIEAAENRLKEEIIKYMAENNSEKFSFSIAFSRIFFAENPDILSQLNENARLKIQYNNSIYELFVSSYSYSISSNSPLPDIKVDLSDVLTISQNVLQNAITEVKADMINSINAIDWLSIGEKHFLRKDIDDRTKGTLASDKGFEVGNFIKDKSGAKIYIDENTKQSVAEVDKLVVRGKAYYEQLEVINSGSISGKQIISPAGSIQCTNVVDTQVDENGNTIVWDYYRCFFLNEQEGNKISNAFEVGDLAFCQRFNAQQDTANNITNKYYWRAVVGVGTNFIDLSKNDCDTNSDVPEIGDIICHKGNKSDVNRQNLIEISSVDETSPSIVLYQGINTYAINEKNIISFGVNKETNKAFLNLYGDMYVGDRESNSYMKYTPEEGLKVKGKLEVGSKISDALTVVEDGLIQSTLLKLGYFLNGVFKVMSGTNGLYDENANGGGIAAWYGGPMIDKEADKEAIEFAKALLRFNGTGYFAGGNITWNEDGSGSVANGNLSWDANGRLLLKNNIVIGDSEEETLGGVLQLLTNIIDWFEVRTLENGDKVLYTKYNLAAKGEVTAGSAGGEGESSGSGSSGGASTLGELLNVNSDVDNTQSEDVVLIKYANASHWAMRRLADMVGLDTEALAEYLTTNKYAQESYVQEKINDLINGAPTTLDTLKEIADAITANKTIVDALDAAIGNKLDKSQVNELFTALLSNTTTPISITVGGVTKTISQEVLRKSLGLGTAAYKTEEHFATSQELGETNSDLAQQNSIITSLTESLERANNLISEMQEKIAIFEDWGFRLGTLSDGSRVLITPHNFASEGEVTANGTEVNDEFEQRIVVLPEAEYERLVEEGNINETKVYYVY